MRLNPVKCDTLVVVRKHGFPLGLTIPNRNMGQGEMIALDLAKPHRPRVRGLWLWDKIEQEGTLIGVGQASTPRN